MKIIVITGQTATGKTQLAFKLAKKYNGVIINADARQIYNKLDIITGKDYLPQTKIWLYDIVDPKSYFSSYDYVQRTLPLIKKILQNNQTPIIVGGTYFYLKHLLYGIETENIPPNWSLRQQLAKKTIRQLQKLVTQLNLKLNQSEFNNPQRLIRKIEIVQAKTPSYQPVKSLINQYDVKFIGLKFKNREKLRQAIIKRVEERLKKGAIIEVKRLLKQGYTQDDPGLKTIGYQQIIRYLKGEISKEAAIKQWVTKELQYAKRQYTFMKKDHNINWRNIR